MNESEEITDEIRARAKDATRRLADQGKLVEAGWMGYRVLTVPKDASEIQVTETRRAFFAGATHLFFSLMAVMDPAAEPTEADEDKMEKIHHELTAFADSQSGRN